MTVCFAQISSTGDQRPKDTKPTIISLNQNDAISGIEHTSDENSGDIRIIESGIYVVIAAPQIGRTHGTEPRHVDIWLRKNGSDIPHSNVRLVIRTKDDKDVIVNQTMMPFNRDDIINIMMSVEVTDEGLGLETIRPDGEPAIPSIILSMHKIKEYSSLVND
ncbi:MAG: hypothetical protein COA77_03635 [Thaumarchaeota archaeon]|nr:MAG: hypothetical protein COA77_03635 [Nitrososphaerota archaeon]